LQIFLYDERFCTASAANHCAYRISFSPLQLMKQEAD
jgi:hypothetical protein